MASSTHLVHGGPLRSGGSKGSSKVVKSDLDFIGVHSNLLSSLLGFVGVSVNDEALLPLAY